MTVETVVQVAFQVLYTKAQGPFLSWWWCSVPNPFPAPSFNDTNGRQFGSYQELIEALNQAFPELEISTALDGSPLAVSAEGARKLRIPL